jgi:hypothetical protein
VPVHTNLHGSCSCNVIRTAKPAFSRLNGEWEWVGCMRCCCCPLPLSACCLRARALCAPPTDCLCIYTLCRVVQSRWYPIPPRPTIRYPLSAIAAHERVTTRRTTTTAQDYVRLRALRCARARIAHRIYIAYVHTYICKYASHA